MGVSAVLVFQTFAWWFYYTTKGQITPPPCRPCRTDPNQLCDDVLRVKTEEDPFSSRDYFRNAWIGTRHAKLCELCITYLTIQTCLPVTDVVVLVLDEFEFVAIDTPFPRTPDVGFHCEAWTKKFGCVHGSQVLHSLEHVQLVLIHKVSRVEG